MQLPKTPPTPAPPLTPAGIPMGITLPGHVVAADEMSPVALNFIRLQLRPRCDLFAQLIIQANTLVTVWDSLDMTDLVPSDDEPIVDPATAMSRPMTGNEVHAVITLLRGMVAASEANSRAQIKIIVKGALNP